MENMLRKRVILVAIACVIVLATFTRIGYESLGWGGYWYVDLVPPWRR
jgi:hypothetical protein